MVEETSEALNYCDFISETAFGGLASDASEFEGIQAWMVWAVAALVSEQPPQVKGTVAVALSREDCLSAASSFS